MRRSIFSEAVNCMSAELTYEKNHSINKNIINNN